MATELGKAYVQIVPSAKGISGDIENALNSTGAAAGEKAGEKSGKGFGSKFASASSKALQAIGKTTLAATGAAAAGIGKVVKESLSSFSEYEQLKGGAELMFGDAYDYIAEKAANAYSTVQMSQNDYLQQVNGFATGLKNSLGGDAQAAAELADKIINSQADIVAATGKDAESVQNAFNGIMRGQFNMLDNLGLGIDATKEGMEKVLDMVNETNGTNYEMGNLADMEAALVDYVSLCGMAGYAQAEAAGTIQGSLSMTKAAWDNLLTGLADPDADIGQLMDNLISSAEKLLNNVEPVIEQILVSISGAIERLVPVITGKLPPLVAQILPPLLSASVSLISGLASALPGLLQTLVQAAVSALVALIPVLLQLLPALLNTAMQIVMYLANVLIQLAPQLIPAGVQLIMQLIQGILQNLPQLIVIGLNLITAVVQGLSSSYSVVFGSGAEIIAQLVNGLIQNLPQIIEAGINLIVQLVVGLISEIDALIEAGGILVEALVRTIVETDWGAVGKKILTGIKNAIFHGKDEISTAATDLCNTTSAAMENISSAANANTNRIVSAGTEALRSEMTAMKSATSETAAAVERIGSTGTESLRQEMSKIKNEASEAASVATSAADSANAAFQGMNIQLPAMDTTQLSASMSAAATTSSQAFTSFDWAGVGNAAAAQINTGMNSSPELTAATQSQVTAIETAFRSGNWTTAGHDIASGVASGINSGAGLILSAVNTVVQGAHVSPPPIDWSVLTSTNVTLDLSQMITLDPTGLYNSCSTIAQEAANRIRSYNWVSVGSSIITRIANGMSSSGAMRAAAQRQAAAVASVIRSYGWAAVGQSIVTGIAQGIANSTQTIQQMGTDIGSGIATGITASQETVDKALADLLGNAVDKLTIELKIKSPSKVMADEVGRWIPAGIALGIRMNADSVTDAMNEATAPLTFSASAVRSAAYESGRQYAGMRRESVANGEERDYGNDAVSSFKEALSAMRVELNDREVGRFIERSVVRGFA